MSKKLNIFVLISNQKTLSPIKGDVINEIVIYKMMSKFANVYYNNQLFHPNKNGYGIKALPINSPTKKYDLYYIRNNYNIWRQCPQPKITTALPFIKDQFINSKAIITYTDAWRDEIKIPSNLIRFKFYKKPIVKPKLALTFPQAFEDIFKPLQDNPITKKIRSKMKADFVIAYFGRMVDNCYPHSLLNVIPILKRKFPKINIKVVFAGPNNMKKKLPNWVSFLGIIPHSNMPYYLSACDVYVCNYHHYECNFYGSRHTIECMATGLPIICANFKARKEILGEEYKLFWDYKEHVGARFGLKAELQLFNHLSKLITDKDFKKEISHYLIKRSSKYSSENISKQIHEKIIKLKL